MKKFIAIMSLAVVLSSSALASDDLANGGKTAGKAVGRGAKAFVVTVAKDVYGFGKFVVVGTGHGVKKVAVQIGHAFHHSKKAA